MAVKMKTTENDRNVSVNKQCSFDFESKNLTVDTRRWWRLMACLALKIYAALNFPSSHGWIQCTGKRKKRNGIREMRGRCDSATVTPLSTGENNSTGASRYRVISSSSFVVGARFHRFARNVTASSREERQKLQKPASRIDLVSTWAQMETRHIGFLDRRSLSRLALFALTERNIVQ